LETVTNKLSKIVLIYSSFYGIIDLINVGFSPISIVDDN